MHKTWSDNDGVTALKSVADSLSTLAGVIPERPVARGRGESGTGLPMSDIPLHVEFARIWMERRAQALARRYERRCPLCGSGERRTWFHTQDGYRYEICTPCGMVYIPEILPLEEWERYFADLPEARSRLNGPARRDDFRGRAGGPSRALRPLLRAHCRAGRSAPRCAAPRCRGLHRRLARRRRRARARRLRD